VKFKRIALSSTQGRYDRNTITEGKSVGWRMLWTLKHRKCIKGKVVPTHAMKTCGDNIGIFPGTHNIVVR
jgi:hypothetical protein